MDMRVPACPSAAPTAKLPYDRPDMSPDENGYLAPEKMACQRIDTMLGRAGWVVQDYRSVNLYAGLEVAVRELVNGSLAMVGIRPDGPTDG